MKARGLPHSVGAAFLAGALVGSAAAGNAFAADKFFTLKRERGVWWLVAPDGGKFFSRGVNGVSLGVSLEKYQPSSPRYCALRYHATAAKWRGAVGKRLEKWNFNALGAGSDEKLAMKTPYVVKLGLGAAAEVPWEDPAGLPARLRYREVLAPILRMRDDPDLIGYILDGDLGWWDESVFLHVLKQPAGKKPLKEQLLERLKSEYGRDVKAFLEDFDVRPKPRNMGDLRGALKRAAYRPGRRPLLVEEFVERVAASYYRAAVEEVRKIDKNHLIFSDIVGAYCSQPAARAAARYVDALAVSCGAVDAQGWPSPYYFESLARLTRKPVLVAEFAVASNENASGNKNVNGLLLTVDTQRERAKAAAALAVSAARFPGVVGYHWHQFFDQPPSRGETPSGADFNIGLVDIKDGEYRVLTRALTQANDAAQEVHGTWPGEAGLNRSPQGWVVEPLPGLPIVDGDLDDWDLPASWAPEARSAAPFERFGDVYVAWHAEGLAVAVVYADYRASRAGRRGPLADSERLTLGMGMENERPVVFTLKGIQVLKDPDDPDAGFFTPGVVAVRGGTPFPAEGRFLIKQRARGVERVVELFLPSALFKTDKLEAGAKMRVCVSLRLRANFKELFWPTPFRLTEFKESESWAALVLEGKE